MQTHLASTRNLTGGPMRQYALPTSTSHVAPQRNRSDRLLLFLIACIPMSFATHALGQALSPLQQYGYLRPQQPSLGISAPILTQLGTVPSHSLRTTATSATLTREEKSKLIAPELEAAFALLAPKVKDAFVAFEHRVASGVAHASGTLVSCPDLENWFLQEGLMEEGEVLAVTAGHFAVPAGSDISATLSDGSMKRRVRGKTIIATNEKGGEHPHLDIALIALEGSADLKRKALRLASGNRLKEGDVTLAFGARGETPPSQRVFKVIDSTPREEYEFSDYLCVMESLWAPIFGDAYESRGGNSGMAMVTAQGDVVGVMVARSMLKCEKQADGQIRRSWDETSVVCRTDAIWHLLRKKYGNSSNKR